MPTLPVIGDPLTALATLLEYVTDILPMPVIVVGGGVLLVLWLRDRGVDAPDLEVRARISRTASSTRGAYGALRRYQTLVLAVLVLGAGFVVGRVLGPPGALLSVIGL